MKCPSCGTDNPKDARICIFCSNPLATHPGTPFGETEINAPNEVASFSGGELIANRYQIVREIGRGGMGVVCLVKDQMLQGQEVALKMISSSLVKDPAAHNRFVQEVLAVQSLTHVNIVKVFHLDRYDGQDFFTMEYLQGKSLREILVKRQKQDQIFTLKEAVSIIFPILSALEHAHAKNIIHRDLKPENVIVNGEFPEIEIKVVDFGLARIMSPSRMTSSAMSMGTAYYMSPEQLAGKGDVDERSDLFAVGVILYELLTGEIPSGLFEMPTEIIPELPATVDQIIKKSLNQKPEGRYTSVCELQSVLEELSDGTQKQKRKPGKPQKSDAIKKPAVFWKAKNFSILGAVIVVVVISLVVMMNTREEDKVSRTYDAINEPVQSFGKIKEETPSKIEMIKKPDYKFVKNKTAGELLIITGMVTNRYDHPRNYIRVKGILHSITNKVLSSSTAYCGNILSDSEQSTLELKAIETRLNNRKGDHKENLYVKPGQIVPFMVVFSDLPENKLDLTVEIMSSKKAYN